jgi:threonine 3-dehydrogenase
MTDPAASASGSSSESTDRGSRRSSAVLVTGVAGEVGHGLVTALHERGRRDIVAIDIRTPSDEMAAMCRETYVGDICDSSLLERLLATYEITEIYHLAALLSTRSEFTPETAHEVNVGGTINLLRLAAEQARSHGQRVKFIYPSSIAAQGLPDIPTKDAAGAIREDEHLKPITMYGCNKLYCETLGRYYSKHYRLLAQDRVADAVDFRCVRYPGLISADTVPSGGTSDFAPEMVHAAAEGKPYACFVREAARIPFMTMPEAIDATLKLADADKAALKHTVYSVASFSPTAGEFRDIVLKHFPDAEITFEPDIQRQQIIDSWPADFDCTSAREDWGFTPRYDAAGAFEEYLVPRVRARYR